VRLIASGLTLAVGNALLGFVFGAGFFAPVDYGLLLGITAYLPFGLALSNAYIFEIAICLTVTGAAVLMLDNLGHPTESDQESNALLTKIGQE